MYIALYCLAVWAANYTATMFVPLPYFGAISIGTMIFGVTFTLRDRVHRRGRRVVYSMIGIAAAGMAIMSVALEVPGQIIAASLVAILISEATDTEVYQRLTARRPIVRILGSNAVSIPIDSIIFNVIAFTGIFSGAMIVQLIVGEIIVKTLAGALVALWRETSSTVTSETKS